MNFRVNSVLFKHLTITKILTYVLCHLRGSTVKWKSISLVSFTKAVLLYYAHELYSPVLFHIKVLQESQGKKK